MCFFSGHLTQWVIYCSLCFVSLGFLSLYFCMFQEADEFAKVNKFDVSNSINMHLHLSWSVYCCLTFSFLFFFFFAFVVISLIFSSEVERCDFFSFFSFFYFLFCLFCVCVCCTFVYLEVTELK